MCTSAAAENLPYGPHSNPFIWDNDTNAEAFTQEFVMALANAGTIRLIGITLSPNPFQPSVENLQTYVEYARNSGLRNIPDAVWNLGPYYKTALTVPSVASVPCVIPQAPSPSDACIDSTVPIDTVVSRWIKRQVLSEGTPTNPVVIGAGGALTNIASAYLLARNEGRGEEFAAKAVVYANLGQFRDGRMDISGYNTFEDGWAAFICLKRMKVVIIDSTHDALPIPEFDFIRSLPANELTAYMRSKFEGNPSPWPYADLHGDGDASPVLTFMLPMQGVYFNKVAHVAFERFAPFSYTDPLNDNAYRADLIIAPDPSSDDVFLSKFSQSMAVRTWERAMVEGIPGAGSASSGGGVAPPAIYITVSARLRRPTDEHA